jgi:hypothetical protein
MVAAWNAPFSYPWLRSSLLIRTSAALIASQRSAWKRPDKSKIWSLDSGPGYRVEGR